MTKKKGISAGQAIGGILAGIDGQIFRSTPPANELIAKGAMIPGVPAAGGGRLDIALPGAEVPVTSDSTDLILAAPGVSARIDLSAGGRLASLVVGGHELLKTDGFGPYGWGSFVMAPFAGRIRDGRFTFEDRQYELARLDPPNAIHGTVLDRAWTVVDEPSADAATIAVDLGPGWPFRGRVSQDVELGAGFLRCLLTLEADEPMPASIGWHPWFRRRLSPDPLAPGLELDLDAGSMYRRDAAGIATRQKVSPTPGPWDDCFTDLRRPPILRWPGALELTIESDCPDWVVYTMPEDALCVEPQTAPPDALDQDAAIVTPGQPLRAEMTLRWRSLAD